MMKIHFDRKDFLRYFKLAASAAAAKDVKPILQNVKIVADETIGAVLHATDTEIGIRILVDADVMENGAVLVPVKEFRKMLESAKDDSLTLESKDGGWRLIGKENVNEWHSSDPDEFPDVSDFTAESYYEIGVSAMQTLIKRTIFATDDDHPKYALGGVCFEGSGKTIRTIATNGRALAVQEVCVDCIGEPKIGNTNTDGIPRGLIVSEKTLTLMDKVLKDKSVKYADVEMAFSETHVMFRYNDVTVCSRLNEGRFPKWRDIIPSPETPMVHAVVKCKDLLTAVKSVQVATTDLEPGITLTFENGKVMLQGHGREKGTIQTTIPADFRGKATVEIDPQYLTRMLTALDGDTRLTISMNGVDPVLVTTGDEAYTYVVMPMCIETTFQVLDENGTDMCDTVSERQEQELLAALAVLQADHDLSPEEKSKQVDDLQWRIDSIRQDRKKRNPKYEYVPMVKTRYENKPKDEDDGLENEDNESENEDDSAYEDNTEVPIDEDGYMAWDYLESFDAGVPLALIDPVDGIKQEYFMELPRFCPEESLFRTKGKTVGGLPVVVQWSCVPGTHKLAVTKRTQYGEILPDWSRPSRIVPMDVFTCEMFYQGDMFTARTEPENKPEPAKRFSLQDKVMIAAVGFDNNEEAERTLRTVFHKQAVEHGYAEEGYVEEEEEAGDEWEEDEEEGEEWEEYEEEEDEWEATETEPDTEAEPETSERMSAMDGEKLEDKRINIESDIHYCRHEIARFTERIQECQTALEQYTASLQESQAALESLQAELSALDTMEPEPAVIPAVQSNVPAKVTQWVGATSAKTTVRSGAPPAMKQTAMRLT